MKKKNVIIFVLALLLGIVADKLILTNKKEDLSTENSIQKKNARALSMMLETGAGTGLYEQTTRESWPTDGYKFNAELSKCENGGKLSWDSENNTVIMTGSTSDKCYIYFDVHNPLNSPTIAFNDSNQITISGTTSESEVTYYYSFDNENFTEGSIIPISESGTVYVYAEDETNNKSEVIRKDIEVSNAENGSVTSSYYCSNTGTYQTSSTCVISSYTATYGIPTTCPTLYKVNGAFCRTSFFAEYSSISICRGKCSEKAVEERNKNSASSASFRCYEDSSSSAYACYINLDFEDNIYYCPNGGSLSGTTCKKTTIGTLQYKCSLNNTYYRTQVMQIMYV